MSSPTPEQRPVSDQEREQLSAYLDQELDPAAAEAVTEALTQRPEVRREAETFRKTWDLLDYLPRPTAPASFTEQTLTRLESTKGLLLRQGIRWRRYAIAGWVACLLVAAAFGFWLTYSSGARPAVIEIESPLTDVIPSVEPAAPAKIPRKERIDVKVWQRLQREAIQHRNEKFQRENRLLLAELQKQVTPNEVKQLQAAVQKGGLTYMKLVFELTSKYHIDVDLIVNRAAKEAAAEKAASPTVNSKPKK